MTQTLDVHRRSADLADYQAARSAGAARPSTVEGASKSEVFVITFGITFVILYTLFERWNWPLFSYHPAVNRLDLFRNLGVPEDGPPMFWYGWVVLAAIAATLVGAIATLLSASLLQRITLFACVLAATWPIFYALAAIIDQEASFNAEFLRSVWTPGVPAVIITLASAYLVTPARAERLWTGWLLILPIGGLCILGYSLKEYFLR